MRGAFTETLLELAEQDQRILLLTADLGFMVLEPFAEKYPDRFFNVGVAEQNMIGVATGFAEAGFLPFAYSIVTFASLRPYEVIRDGPVLHRFPVRIAGIGGGYEYGSGGPTHHGLEDVGVMRIQPGMTVVAPADACQTRNALRATYDLPGPVYYRLGKRDDVTVPGLDGRFRLGKAEVIREGNDLLWFTMGAVSAEVAEAANLLAARGIRSTVAVVASVSPPPIADLAALSSRFPLAITVEAHYTAGGLGSLVSEVVAGHGLGCRVIRRGVSTTPSGASGNKAYYDKLHGLDVESLVECAVAEIAPAGK